MILVVDREAGAQGKVGVDINELQNLPPAVPSLWDARWALALSFFWRTNQKCFYDGDFWNNSRESNPHKTYFSQNRGRMT
jgi:hypothetical protein